MAGALQSFNFLSVVAMKAVDVLIARLISQEPASVVEDPL